MVESDCAGELVGFVLGLAGLLVLPLWLLRVRAAHPVLAPGLLVWHACVIGFTLFDFQGHADLFLATWSVALGQGVLLGLVLTRACGFLAGPRRLLCTWALVLGVVVFVRPSYLGGVRRTGKPDEALPYVLDDQREVARELEAVVGGRPLACLAEHFLLVLGESERSSRPSRIVFWHYALHALLARSGETSDATLRRLLEEDGVEVVVVPRRSNKARKSWLPGLKRWLERDFVPRDFGGGAVPPVEVWLRRRR